MFIFVCHAFISGLVACLLFFNNILSGIGITKKACAIDVQNMFFLFLHEVKLKSFDYFSLGQI